jgi:hypothetical protein
LPSVLVQQLQRGGSAGCHVPYWFYESIRAIKIVTPVPELGSQIEPRGIAYCILCLSSKILGKMIRF